VGGGVRGGGGGCFGSIPSSGKNFVSPFRIVMFKKGGSPIELPSLWSTRAYRKSPNDSPGETLESNIFSRPVLHHF